MQAAARNQASRASRAGQRKLRPQPFVAPVASLGGRRNVGGGSGTAGGGLILDPSGGGSSQRRPAGAPPRLIIPGGGSNSSGGAGGGRMPSFMQEEPAGGTILGAASANKFRPPPGFMNADGGAADPALSSAEPEELMRKLRSRAGAWHQLAKYLPVLYAKGFNSSMVDEATGVTPAEQNRWVVASTIYDSLVDSGRVEPEVLAHYDQDGEGLLYPFRLLSIDKRCAAAKYICEQGLSEPECEVLARSMKEWDRRAGERQGFTDSPGDCLAFKFLRDAQECRSAEDRESKVAAGLAVADSDEARARLQELLQEAAAASTDTQRAMLNVLRMNHEELGFRPLAMVRALGVATAEDVRSAPRTSQRGAFGMFEVQAAGSQWVALPQWKALEMARHPVALPIAECMDEPAVMVASRARTEEEKKRMAGPGLLVVEADMRPGGVLSTAEAQEDAFFVVEGPGGALQLMDGTEVQSSGAAIVAEVLFLARPPRNEMMTTPEMLQL